MSRIAVVGGHGQVARHLLVALRRSEHDPVALVRREEYREELESRGAEVRLLDIERDDAAAFARAFEGCDAVVFAAGGGPDGNKERKRTVDLEGSLKSIEGAREAGIDRFVQVSAINVDEPLPTAPTTCGAPTSRPSATPTRPCAPATWPGRSSGPAGSPTTRRPGWSRSVRTSRGVTSPGPTSPRCWPRCSTSRRRSASSGTS